MICRNCGEHIEEKGQTNVSPIAQYPICEDCKDGIVCNECYEGDNSNLYYVEKYDTILCAECLIKLADARGCIHTVTTYYSEDGNKICDSNNTEPLIKYLNDDYDFNLQEVVRRGDT